MNELLNESDKSLFQLLINNLDDIATELNKSTISPKLKKALKEGFEFRKTLTSETDRGCALITGSYLDFRLQILLKNYFVNDKSITDTIFSNSGSLGTFSSRIDMAYLLGLISKNMHRDLHLIRKIRNDFGHDPSPISFETTSIKNRCLELKHNLLDIKTSPRGHFIRVVCTLLGRIEAISDEITNIKPMSDTKIDTETKSLNTELTVTMLYSALVESEMNLNSNINDESIP